MDEDLLKLAYSKLDTDASYDQFKSDLASDKKLQELVYSKFNTDATFEEFKIDLFGNKEIIQEPVQPKKEVAEVSGVSASPSADTVDSSLDSRYADKLPDVATILGDVDSPIARRQVKKSVSKTVDENPKIKQEVQELKETGNIKVAEDVRDKYISDEVHKVSKTDKFGDLSKIVQENTQPVDVDPKTYLDTVYEELSSRANNKYEKEDTDLTEIKDIYGDLDKYGLNSKDFDGFIEQGNSNIKDIYRAGYFTTDTTDILLNSEEEKELRETAKHNTLSIYLNDRLANLNGKFLGLMKQGKTEEASEVRNEVMKTVKGYQDFVKTELPNYHRVQQQKLVDEYNEYKDAKNIGGIKKTVKTTVDAVENLFSGIQNASGDTAAYLLDLVGADDYAEYERMISSYNKEFDNSSLDYGVVSGFKVNHKGTNYRVTEDNRIIDLDLGKDVTAISDKIGLDKENIINKAKASNNYGTDFSTTGLIKKGSNVLGNLAFQIAATRGINGSLGLTTKAKTLLSSMTVQSGIVASSAYEETLKALRDANIDDNKAKGEALDLSLKMGAVTALTSILSPNSAAIGVTNKAVDKQLIKKLANSYATGGKDAFKKTFLKSLKDKGAVMGREGIEESIQELTELVAQKNFNATINQDLGDDVLDTNISKDEIIETIALSFSTSALAAGLGKTRSDYKDKLSIIDGLSKDVNSSTKYINQLEEAGAISKESADRIKKNVINYTKYSNKIPQDIELTKVEPLLDKLDERNKLLLRKKNQDAAFHKQIKENIEKVDSEISLILSPDKPLVIPNKKELKQTLNKSNWGVLTAENPNNEEVSPEQNKQFNNKAKKWLSDRGYEVQDVKSKSKGLEENSFFVPDLNINDAIDFANEFNQESVATNKGLVYQDGSYSPRTGDNNIGEDFDDNYSKISLPDGDVSFQSNYDLGSRVTEGISETIDEDTDEKRIADTTKQIADNIRKFKTSSSVRESMSKLQSDPTGLFKFAWDGALETVATTIETTGNVAQAIDDGFKKLKESDWYKQLSDNGKRQAERKFKDEFRDEIKEVETVEKTKVKDDSVGVIGKIDKGIRTLEETQLAKTVSQKFIDVFSNINQAIKTLDGASDFWKKQGLYESKTANLVDTMLTKVKDGVKAISKSKFSVNDVSQYMYAKHAIDRNKYVRENVDGENPFGSGMTDQKAESILNTYTGEQKNKLEELSNTFYNLINESRGIMVKTGLMSQESVDKLKMSNDTYVPLTGFADEQIEIGSNIVQGKKINVKGKEFKGITGRTTEANNIIANIVKQYTDIAIRGNKNELLQSFDDINKINPDKDIPFKIYTQENLPRTKSIGADGKIRYTKDPAAIDASFVGFKKNGKQFYIQFENAVLAENLNRATDATIDAATRYLGKLNRFLSSAFTQYNPAFMIPNFFRDLQTGLINLKAQADINVDLQGQDLSRKVAKNITKSIKAIHQVERGITPKNKEYAKYYEEFKEEGAKTGWANRRTLAEITQDVNSMEKMMSGNKISPQTLKKGVEGFFKVLDDANTAIENGVRLSTFVEARKAGLSKLDAASLAKELTINFNRRGEMGGLMNTLYLFFNASVQGTVNFKNNMLKFKTYTDSKGRTRKTLNRGQKAAVAVMLSNIALTMYNIGASGEDEESGLNIYNSIPDYEKERNLIIMKPDGKSYFKIPLPYGYNIFANMGTMMAESSFGDRKASNASAFMLGSAFGSFAPFSSPQRDSKAIELAYLAAPTITKPIGMLFENKDFFGQQIYRENFPTSREKLAPAHLGSKRTAEIYKTAAIWMNSVGGGNAYEESFMGFHPDKAQFMVDFFGGGALKFMKDLFGTGQTLLRQQEGADLEIEARDIPLLRKVYGEDTSFPEMQIYYNVKEKSQRRLNFLKSDEGKEAHMDEPSERANLIRLNSYYKDSDKQLKDLRKQEKRVLLLKDVIKRAEELEKLDVKKRKVIAKHVKRYLRLKERLVGDYE